MKTKERSKKNALTLIELIVSILILGVVMAGQMKILQEGLSFAKKTNETVYAYNIVTSILEDYSNWDTLTTEGDGLNQDIGSITLKLGSQTMTFQREIDITSSLIAGIAIKDVTARVRWIGGYSNQNKSIEIHTTITYGS